MIFVFLFLVFRSSWILDRRYLISIEMNKQSAIPIIMSETWLHQIFDVILTFDDLKNFGIVLKHFKITFKLLKMIYTKFCKIWEYRHLHTGNYGNYLWHYWTSLRHLIFNKWHHTLDLILKNDSTLCRSNIYNCVKRWHY